MFRFILLVSTVLAIGICGRNSGEQGGRGPRPGPPGRQMPPPYLRNVTEEAIREYFDIVRSQNETIAAQKQEIQQWGQKYGVLDQVNEFDGNMTRFKSELNQNITELISQLTQGQQQLNQIMDNEDQTRQEQHQAIEAFRNQSRPVFDTLIFMGGLFRPRRAHGPDGDFGGRGGQGGRGGPRGGPGGPGGSGDRQGPGSRGDQEQRWGQGSFGGQGQQGQDSDYYGQQQGRYQRGFGGF